MAKKSSKKKAPSAKAAVKKPAAGTSQAKKASAKSAGGVRRPAKSEPSGVVSAQALQNLDKATYVLLHLLVILVPLAFGQFTFDQFDMPKVVTLRFLTLAMAGTWSARFLLSRKTQIRRTPLDWFILAFLAWVTLSTIFSVHLPTALLGKYRRYEGWISLINYGAVFFIAVQTLRTYRRLTALAKSMVITGAVIGMYGIMQYLGYDIMQWGQLPFDKFRAFATYGNPDLLVGYLAVLVPIAVGLCVVSEDRYESVAYGFCTAVIFMSLLVTFSRSAWVGLAVALPYLGFVLWRQEVLNRRKVIAIGVCLALILGVLVVYSMRSDNPVTSIYSRLGSLLKPTEGSAGTRFEIWKSAIDATKAKPILGFGPDTFRLIFPQYKTVRYVQMAGYRSVADNAHSYPFQLAPAIGIPGVILFYLLVFYGFGRMAGITLRRDGHENERVIIASFGAGALAYGIHLLFGLSVTGTTIFLWICFAAFMLPFVKAVEINWRPSSDAMRTAGFVAVAAVLLTGTYLNWRFLDADMANLRSYQYQRVDGAAAMAGIDEALALNPYWDAYRAQKVMLLMDKANSSGDRDTIQGTINFARESIMQSPREYDNYLFLSNAYSTASRILRDQRLVASSLDTPYLTQTYNVDDPDRHIPKNSLDVALYALKNVEPNAPSAMVQAGLGYLDLGATEKGIEMLKKAVTQDPKYAEAFFYLGNAYEKTGDKQQALAAYDEAIKIRLASVEGQAQGGFPEASAAAARLRGGAK